MKLQLEWIDGQEQELYEKLYEDAIATNKGYRKFDLHGLCKMLGYCDCAEASKPEREGLLDCE